MTDMDFYQVRSHSYIVYVTLFRVSYRIFDWGGRKLLFDGTMWHAMHAALLGGSGGMPPPQEN